MKRLLLVGSLGSLAVALGLIACDRTSTSAPVASSDATPTPPPSVDAAPATAARLGDGAHDYRGTLGKTSIAMHLVRSGDAISGAYLYVSVGHPIALTGTADGDGALSLTEAADGAITGSFRLQPSGAGFGGAWSDPQGKKTFAVELVPGSPTEALLEPPAEARRCTAADVAITLGPVVPTKYQPTVPVVVTNHSPAPCSLRGHVAAEFLSGNGTYTIAESPVVTPKTIVLAPNRSAHADLTYLEPDPGQPRFVPAALALTLPGEARRAAAIPWTHGPILDQQSATHPGTFIVALAPSM